MSEEPLANVFDYLDYREFLRATYAEGKRLKKLSYRAFSRRAGLLSPNYLKLVIDGKRNITHEMAQRFAQALHLTAEGTEYFELLVRREHPLVHTRDPGDGGAFGAHARRHSRLAPRGRGHSRAAHASPRPRANPVTHGYARQHLLLKVNRSIGHAAPEAGGAKSTAFAGESYELRVAAAAANEVQAACGQEPAAQILLELARHELRKAAMLGEIFQHLRPMGLHGLVEHASFGSSARAAVPANGRV